MKKKAIQRGLLGFPLGITVGYLITILTSLIWANGYYSPCVPELTALMGSEINAVLLQALLCGLLGAGCAAGSVVWELERWSIVKQTGAYFLLISVLMLPAAYFSYWMEHSITGLLGYFGVFALIFAAVWMVCFFFGKHSVSRINAALSKANQNNEPHP